jgi:hypothetical protein
MNSFMIRSYREEPVNQSIDSALQETHLTFEI